MHRQKPQTLHGLHALVCLLDDPPALHRVAHCTLNRAEMKRFKGLVAHLEAIVARGVTGSPFYNTATAKLAALRDLQARGALCED